MKRMSMLNRPTRITWTMILLCAIGFGFPLYQSFAQNEYCDHRRATAAGDCTTAQPCGDINNEALCEGSTGTSQIQALSFECTIQTDKNCVSKNEYCYNEVYCKWVHGLPGHCSQVPGSGGIVQRHQVLAKVTSDCLVY